MPHAFPNALLRPANGCAKGLFTRRDRLGGMIRGATIRKDNCR
jgi:hypothetical protein